MASTLQMLAFSVGGGFVICLTCFVLFGIAVRRRHKFIAPRAWARPAEVIYNPNARSPTSRKRKQKCDIDNREQKETTKSNKSNKNNESKIGKCDDDKDELAGEGGFDTTLRHPQDRGNAFFGWIGWTLSLTYDTMLQGVPGTGTRQSGMGGSMLTVNMDGIVLLCFHAFALRVSIVATLLYVVILIPLYQTSYFDCSYDFMAIFCNDTETVPLEYKNSAYIQSTIEALPSLLRRPPSTTIATPDNNGIIFRLYMLVFLFWCVIFYVFRELRNEYIHILAMRRVYFLEHDIFQSRKQLLQRTRKCSSEYPSVRKIKPIDKKQRHQQHEHFTHEADTDDRREDGKSSKTKIVVEEPHLLDRETYIPHPELYDTVANVSLYSVLVGGVPSLPKQEYDLSLGQEPLLSKRDMVDWQLSLTTAFFDQCVPNQPGFSSSVAAVTIIPGAKAMATAWKKWSIAAYKLRKLRYLHKVLKEKQAEQIIQQQPYHQQPEKFTENAEISHTLPAKHEGNDNDENLSSVKKPTTEATNSSKQQSPLNMIGAQQSVPKVIDTTSPPSHTDIVAEPTFPKRPSMLPCHTQSYYRQMIGSFIKRGEVDGKTTISDSADGNDDDEFMVENEGDLVHESMFFGPEQAAVYSREFANVASGCTPNGFCFESSIHKLSLEEILDLVEDAEQETAAAYEALRVARDKAIVFSDIPNDSSNEQLNQQQVHDDNIDHFQKEQANATSVGEEIVDNFKNDGHFSESDSRDSLSHPSSHRSVSIDFDSRSDDQSHIITNLRPNKKSNSRFEGIRTDKTMELEVTLVNRKVSLHSRKKNSKSSCTGVITTTSAPSNLDSTSRTTFLSSSIDFYNQNAKVSTTNSILKENSFKAATSPSFMDVETGPLTLFEESPRITEHHTSITKPSQSYDNTCILSPVPREDKEAVKDKDLIMQQTQWEKVKAIVDEAWENDNKRLLNVRTSSCSTGNWSLPSPTSIYPSFIHFIKKFAQNKRRAVDNAARDSTYCVVTFTSRQAAISARACLADGRGHRRWLTHRDIPIPPLADAPAWDPGFRSCRNCCQPVTISLNEHQHTIRYILSITLLGFLYVFYTVPLTLASQLVAPEALQSLFPQSNISDVWGFMSGMLTALIWSTFFAFCPMIFIAIANFGSIATSVAHAEKHALQYYWWFMVLTAFSGQTLASMGIQGLTSGLDANDWRDVITKIASTIPTVTAVTWLNWIIFRVLTVIPMNYLLQINSYLFHIIGFECCSRMNMGGGPGGPVPYRIYVDSGIVFLCLMALAPVSPLIAPACLVYFLFLQPLLRRNLIFIYRPRYDGGGHRWPFIFTMCISSLIVAEILITVLLALKNATGPAIFAGLAIPVTLLFSHEINKRYLRSFQDAALCQTSMLDGWYDENSYSFEKREEFRRFLVDAHKAAYVPVCLASPETEGLLTAEPAVVIPRDGEVTQGQSLSHTGYPEPCRSDIKITERSIDEAIVTSWTKQRGATLGRASLQTLANIARIGSTMSSGRPVTKDNVLSSLLSTVSAEEDRPQVRDSSTTGNGMKEE